MVIKIDGEGEMFWSIIIEDSIDYVIVGQFVILNDGFILFVFYIGLDWFNYGRVYYVVKLISEGEVEWVCIYDEVDRLDDWLVFIVFYLDGGFVMGWVFDIIQQFFVYLDEGLLLR